MRDYEDEHDITSWTLVVKRPNKTSFYCRGNFVNILLDSAFKDTDKDNKAAIQAAKDTLWKAFKDLYEGKVSDPTLAEQSDDK